MAGRRTKPRGQFVKREGSRRSWHLVESWVANDAITYCGRRLTDEPTDDGGLQTTDANLMRPNVDPLCKVCEKGVDGGVTRLED